jgi:hypothetical protein
MKWILLVTWIIAGQPPSNYQTIFQSGMACEGARREVLQERERLKSEQDTYVARIRSQPGIVAYDPPPPQVTAICAPTGENSN